MRLVRRRLIALALAALASQFASLSAAPVAICLATGAESGGDAVAACTCTHGAAECPMHKPTRTPPVKQTRWCAGCNDGMQLVLTSIGGVAGVLVDRLAGLAPPPATELVAARRAASLELARRPFVPPPRRESPL